MLHQDLPRPTGFPHRRAGHCGSGSLRDILEHRGLDFGAGPLSEGMVFGLGGALGFLYLEGVPAAGGPVYLVGRTADLERHIAPHLGALLDERATDDPDEGWAWVREEIDAGRPPMVWADIQHLDYLRVRMHNTRHDIVIAGYDEVAGVAWIADNDRDELQPCSLESLARARDSAAFPGPNRHTTFVYDWPAQLRDPRAAATDAIAQTVGNMRGDGGPLAGLPGATGLNGIDALAASYPQWPQRFGDELPAALGALRVFIVKAGTGGAMFRGLQADFLREMGDLLGDDDLTAAGAVYADLAATWVALADATREDHAAGLAHMQRIAALEHAGVAALEAFAQSSATSSK